jgi:ABC-type transport system substrate-binding protein
MDYAINKEDIIAVSGYGIFGAAHQVPIPGTPGYIESQDTARPFNPDKARELLKEAVMGTGSPLHWLSRTPPAKTPR